MGGGWRVEERCGGEVGVKGVGSGGWWGWVG